MRRIHSLFRNTMALALVAIMICGVNCGGSSDDAAPIHRSYGGTQAPGDYHKYSLYSDGTWEATNVTLNLDYSGTYTSLPSGFLKLTVTDSTDSSVIIPSECYACELPNTALLVQRDPDQEIIVCSFLGGTVSPGTSQYWGIYNPKNDDPDTPGNEEWSPDSPAFGKWEVTVGSDMKISVEETSITWKNAVGGGPWETTQIHEYFVGDEEGTYTLENSADQVRLASNPSGAFIIDFDPTNTGIAGAFGGPETELSWTDDILKGEYIGFLFRSQPGGNTDPMVFPVWAAAGTGPSSTTTDMWDPQSLYGSKFIDDSPENGKEEYDNGDPNDGAGGSEINGVRFNGTDATTPFGAGLFQVNDYSDPLDTEGEEFFFAAFLDPVSGKKIVYGIGSNGDGTAYNVLLFQK